MKADLIRIGNSRGIRIPKAVIEQCGFDRTVELRVEGHTLVIAPGRKVREGWDEAFKLMAERGDDAPLLPEGLTNQFDETDWEW